MTHKGLYNLLGGMHRKPPASLLPECGVCKLHTRCNSPKMKVDGKGEKRTLIIGEAPGEQEDEQGRPFVGTAGSLLKETLQSIGVNLRRDCWVTNALICRPTSDSDKNRTPTDKEINHCRPNIIREVQTLKPDVIVPLGGVATKSLLSWLWKEDVGNISRWAGQRIPCQKINAWVCPTYHPSYVVRSQDKKSYDVIQKTLFTRHLKAAFSLQGKPWDTVLDYNRLANVTWDADQAVNVIRDFMAKGVPIAFDYETNMLKPESDLADIVCVSLSDGETSWAFPWQGEVIKAFSDLLRSDTPKVGWNVKFEERWTRRILGHSVNNWIWDGMLAAHLIDNRSGVTGLKFQAFALLGVDSYDTHVKAYFDSKGGCNSPNRIRDVPMQALLKYCSYDALFEYKVAEVQMKILGVNL